TAPFVTRAPQAKAVRAVMRCMGVECSPFGEQALTGAHCPAGTAAARFPPCRGRPRAPGHRRGWPARARSATPDRERAPEALVLVAARPRNGRGARRRGRG